MFKHLFGKAKPNPAPPPPPPPQDPAPGQNSAPPQGPPFQFNVTPELVRAFQRDMAPQIDQIFRADRALEFHEEFYSRYKVSGATEDLDKSIQWYQEYLDVSPDDDPDRPGLLRGLGYLYGEKYEKTKAMVDLEMSLQQYQKSVDITPPDHPDRASRLQSLGLRYRDKYEKTKSTADLDTSLQQYQKAVDITPPDHPELASRLQRLGLIYGDKYEKTKTVADLDMSLLQYQKAVDLTPPDHPGLASQLQHLGLGHLDKYHKTGAVADQIIACQLMQKALDTMPHDHADRPSYLGSLSALYTDKYASTEAIEDLNLAIQHLQDAIDTIPHDNPQRSFFLWGLGSQYRNRYKRIGVTADLEMAIQLYQQAVDITPHDDSHRASRLQSLGLGYRSRYHHTGAMADLQIAIQQCQKAVDITPRDHPDRSSRLQSLEVAYRDKYQRTKSMADLTMFNQLLTEGMENKGLSTQQFHEALDVAPGFQPPIARQFQRFGHMYKDRYNIAGAMEAMEIGVKQFQIALELTPEDHPDQAGILYELGSLYRSRFYKFGAMEDLDISIQYYQRALDKTPPDHPDRASRFRNLGLGYANKYRRTRAVSNREIAVQHYQDALDHISSPIQDRLQSGRALVALQAQAKSWSLAYQAASTSVSLIPLLMPRSLEHSDRQHLIAQVIGLASDALAIALNAGKPPFDAVQVLELGRGIIAGTLNEIRADLSDLQREHPQLAEEFKNARDQLDAPISMQRQADQRYNSSQKLEQLIRSIRKLSDFDRFLLVPSEDELKAAAVYGPIVVVNVSDYRCDALIIEENQLRTLTLPLLHNHDIRARATESLADPAILEWLWETIAEPVLETLGFTETPSPGCWRRMWWVPTGPLAKFPIHAAGCHSQRSSNTVLDRVVSSYSSSVRALIHGRQNRLQSKREPGSEKVVLVAMQRTPDKNSLEYVSEEVAQLEKLCVSMNLQVSKPQPFQKDVLSALEDCKVFHFAGHGKTDSSDPSNSCLLLQDWRTTPLTVANLLETNLSGRTPFLAYLSACGTGQIKQDQLIDEGLHLISACQLAGFRHVIGTLWKVDDKFCVYVATRTYMWMKEHEISDKSVSEGLHHACRKLRDQWIAENPEGAFEGKGVLQMVAKPPHPRQGKVTTARDADLIDDDGFSPLYWVPYAHFGV